MHRAILVVMAVAAVAGCGKRGDLAYAPGQKTPAAPLGAKAAPTPGDMLRTPVQAQPSRVDDPVSKSRPREADRFDLPPPR